MYVWMYQVNKTWEILLLWLKICIILHSIKFEILTCTKLTIAFPGLQISKFSGGGGRGACPQTPLEARAIGARILNHPLWNIPVNTNTLQKTSATRLHLPVIASPCHHVYARRPVRGFTEYKVHRQRLYLLCRLEVNVGEVFTANKKRVKLGNAFKVVNHRGQLGHLQSELVDPLWPLRADISVLVIFF